jgi:methylmalonyl-CoA mutase
MMETLTQELYDKAKKLITDIKKSGGMTQFIESGLAKSSIEESATRRQAQIDSGKEVIVGVNKYKSPTKDDFEVRDVDNDIVREKQIQSLKKIKKERDEKKVQECLKALTDYAKTGIGNGLELSIQAMKVRCTVGEVSYALEQVWGRYKPEQTSVTGAYMEDYGDKNELQNIQNTITTFFKDFGRRPRMLVAKMGQDGHDRGAKVVASSFSDLGFDVDLSPLFSTPKEVAKQAIENDVHIIGVSSQAAGHKTLIPELLNELTKQEGSDIIVICGGVIPEKDYEQLYKLGVALIFGPGTSLPKAAAEIITMLRKKQKVS